MVTAFRALVLSTLLSGRLHACAVCFGGDNPSIGRAFSLGIFILMGFTFLILGSLAFAVYRIEARRAQGLGRRAQGLGRRAATEKAAS